LLTAPDAPDDGYVVWMQQRLKAPVLVRARERVQPTFHYIMQTEAHVFAFSMAANVLLSFFPFLIVMVSICRFVLHWRAAEQAIYFALDDYFPGEIGAFITRNLKATVWTRGPMQYGSVLLLLFTANGIFEPLEVALNRLWGAARNRSFFRNQLVSLGLIFVCGALALISTLLTATNQEWMHKSWPQFRADILSLTLFKLGSLLITMLILFLVYWLLPNCKVPWSQSARAAFAVGVLLEGLKYINLLTWPWLRAKLTGEYGPFVYSVTVVLWSFVAAMVVLAGAEWAARRAMMDGGGLPQLHLM
jgi:membrane protein